MPAARLTFEQVGVQYRRGVWTVRDVDLTVEPGAVLGLVGESGSGKSTLARAAVGLVQPAAGRILLDGVDVRSFTGRHRPVQMVFQDPYSALDPRRTVGNAVAEGMPERGRGARRAETARLLELVQLDPTLADRLPADLSGGQRQRVSLARALAARPRVLIADEITSALDVSVQGAVLNVLRDVQAELQLTMLFISHNLAVVRYVSSTVAVMRDGRLIECRPTQELVDDPREAYTRDLLAAVPVLGERLVPAGEPR